MDQNPEATLKRLLELGPAGEANVDEICRIVFAPWVRRQGLRFLKIRPGRVSALLPQDPQQQFFTGAMCGQALMSAVDTVMSVTMASRDRPSRGTISQSSRFLRPAIGDDLLIEAEVLRWGRHQSYGEARVRLAESGELVMHATAEFAF